MNIKDHLSFRTRVICEKNGKPYIEKSKRFVLPTAFKVKKSNRSKDR